LRRVCQILTTEQRKIDRHADEVKAGRIVREKAE
jgi:hypothetical protein